MFELSELKGLIYTTIYDMINELSDTDRSKLIAETDQTITRYTGYTKALLDIEDQSEVKASLKGSYAHLLEHLALSMVSQLPDHQAKRINFNYSETIRQLKAMPTYNSETGVASRVVKIRGAAKW